MVKVTLTVVSFQNNLVKVEFMCSSKKEWRFEVLTAVLMNI